MVGAGKGEVSLEFYVYGNAKRGLSIVLQYGIHAQLSGLKLSELWRSFKLARLVLWTYTHQLL
jgi:hypothetical protein